MESSDDHRLGIRVILFPAPLMGYLNPMIRLAYILHSKGFSITIIHTQINSPNKSTHPDFKFYPINDGLSKEEETTTTTDFNRSLELMLQLNQSCVEPFQDVFAKLVAKEDEEPVACLITNFIWPFTQTIADAHNIPRIIFRPDCRLEFPSTKPIKIKDIPKLMPENREALSNFYVTMSKSMKSTTRVIWNSFKELEEPQLSTMTGGLPPTDQEFLIGLLNEYAISNLSSSTTDRTCISWLDAQSPKSVIYVSFGSKSTLKEDEFMEMAWGLVNSKQPFLWVVPPRSVCGSEWLEKLPNVFMDTVGKINHMIIKWAPQSEVLAHPAVGCFWTHCGWNSVLECLSEGVPMICSPSFAEQSVVAELINNYWKVGVQLENGMERKAIEKAIKRIMMEKEGEEIKERSMHFKEKANGCVKEGGSSFMELERLVNYILSLK